MPCGAWILRVHQFPEHEQAIVFPFPGWEIKYTPNIYPPYLAYSNKGLGCGVIPSEMPNTEQFQFKGIVI